MSTKNLTALVLGNAMSIAQVGACHGYETSRDFNVVLKSLGQPWHGGAILVDKITRENFPGMNSQPLFFGDYAPDIDLDMLKKKSPKLWAECGFDKLGDLTGKKLIVGKRANQFNVPISEDDGKISGVPFDMDTYTLFDARSAYDWTLDLLKGTKFEVQSIGMIKDRKKYFMTFDLTELRAMNLKGHKWLLGVVGGTDRNTSPSWNLSNVRQVCDNTVRLSLSTGETMFSQKLSKDFLTNLNAKKIDMQAVCGFARVWNETLQAIESKKADETQAAQVFAGEIVTTQRKLNESYKLVRIKKGKDGVEAEKASTRALGQIAELVSAFRSGDGNKGTNRADIFNALTQVYTRGPKETTKAKLDQWTSSEFGTYATRKEEFFSVCADDARFEEMRKVGEVALAGN